MPNIKKLIAAIVPDVYCVPEKRDAVKKIIKEKGKDGYAEAAKNVVKFISANELFVLDDAKMNPLNAEGLKAPFEEHKLTYDSPGESLEPLYFWILDFVKKGMFDNVEKITDNFSASPGSGYFSELGQKATVMQQEASKMLGAVNQVLKSILNIIYDLKEFSLRLDVYDKYKKGSEIEKTAALLSLKQIWLDSVDIKRGNTSIKGLASQFDYVTLIDAFMAIPNMKAAERKPEDGGFDLNDRVRRILLQRLIEFEKWLTDSEIELRKRYEIEKNYLRSQYNTIQLYSRWIRPYLEAARKLENNRELGSKPDLVTTFNTVLLELVLLCDKPYNAASEGGDIDKGELPELFKSVPQRKYSKVLFIEFSFRGIPQRVGQGYSYGGQSTINFTAVALREDELADLKKELEKDSFNDVLQYITGATTESLDQMKKEIYGFLDMKEPEKAKEEKEEDLNPFSALFSFFKSDTKKENKKQPTGPDTEFEKILRSQAIIDARDTINTVYFTFKKSQRMPAP